MIDQKKPKNTEIQQELKELRTQEEERLVQYLSQKYQLPYIHSSHVQVEPDALHVIHEQEARLAEAAVFKRKQRKLLMAVKNRNSEPLQELLASLKKRGFSVELHLASLTTLEQFWEYYKDIVATSATTPGSITITNEELEENIEEVRSIEDAKRLLARLGTMKRTRRISKNIEFIISIAIALDVSDVHIEPTNKGGVVRYRIDGVLLDVLNISLEERKQLATRLKLVSGMKINITKEAQDGAFTVSLQDRQISIRASIIPEDQGGSFVLRILDPKNILLNIRDLGIHPVMLRVFKEEMRKPNGIIITTGPTGSGKTTTLYSFLNMIKSPERKIITLENPIEYRIEGIVQTQIEKSYTFAGGLRAVLRQDPDVILVGEIRDSEVAQVAVNASLTGHLVLSTLHTNDAIGSLPRLKQFGIDTKVLSRALNMVIAQRLVRKLCPHCSEPHQLTKEEARSFQVLLNKMPVAYKKEGLSAEGIRKPGSQSNTCKHCNGGYKGRTGLFETFRVIDEVERVVTDGGGASDLREVVRRQELPFMEDDGVYKVCTGVTSLDELGRVLGIFL